ncbi:MAG TPA: hypothetical protein VEB22_13360 [Phycisphaerales bacterium]|nr:hypothetical protein [Phycisphaerales bacterium]
MAKNTQKTLGAAQLIVVSVIAGAGLVAATVGMIPARAPNAVNTRNATTTSLVALHYLGVVGLEADAMAAAGVSAGQAEVVMENLQDHLGGDGSQLQTVIDTWGEAYRTADLARRAVQSSKGSVDALTAANSALTTAASAKQAAISAAFTAAVDGLDEAVVQRLATIHANRAQNVPAQYLVVNRTAEQWRQLRDALSHKNQRATLGAQADAEVASFIADADADTPVSAAAGRIASNLAAIQAAIAQ